MMVERVSTCDEVTRTLEQILQAQQRPDAFIERVLVTDQARPGFRRVRKFRRILRELPSQDKLRPAACASAV